MAPRMSFPVFSMVVVWPSPGSLSWTPTAIRHHDSNMNTLWFFIMIIVSSVITAIQYYVFTSNLIAKLRQDKLRTVVDDNPQKVEGLAGITLGAIIQAITT
ncbi:hypothetical protein EDC04DRAFT_1886502 [Pisolithus marmoratus]|nr:hypothetical protein EDC04DRAFT_1886502 [Pisolithus marmoratus]